MHGIGHGAFHIVQQLGGEVLLHFLNHPVKLLAFAVDHLHVLADGFVLLLFPAVQQIQGFHVLTHLAFFEQLRLQILQGDAVKLAYQQHQQQVGAEHIRCPQEAVQHGKCAAQHQSAEKLPGANLIDVFLGHYSCQCPVQQHQHPCCQYQIASANP